MSQEGAMRMIEIGYDFLEVLRFYYTDVHLIDMKMRDFYWELRNEEEEHLFYFPNFEEALKTRIVLEHYETKFICKCGEGYYTNSIEQHIP
ncbi:hypothetical protein N9K77_01125 [bacterium]|nr:hypothetical protein [bacterium]